MGLFDVFSKGGKYFGKAIEPKCEYCEHGKRSSDGNKVLCTKKGMVDAGYHCTKFLYSPLKRIPVKQLERVGWLDGDYEEKDFAEISKKKAEEAKAAAKEAAKAPAPAPKPVTPAAPSVAPAPAPKPATPVTPSVTPAPAPKPVTPVTPSVTPAPAPKPVTPAAPSAAPAPAAPKPAMGGDLASLAAMAEAAGEYNPEPAPAADAPQENGGMNALSSM
ncbi:MAG: hypothetical protein IKI45_07120 [Oscillospiraceae bacterium]|nr:hypothetical protein [Oscillospiraceae bacterium]